MNISTNTALETHVKEFHPSMNWSGLVFFPMGTFAAFVPDLFELSGMVIPFFIISLILNTMGWRFVFEYFKEYKVFYNNELSEIKNSYDDDQRALHAFSRKYKSPASLWALKFFGREGERILISKYAVKEPWAESIRWRPSRDIESGDAIALSKTDNTIYRDHPYTTEYYVAIDKDGLRIEQEVSVNPLVLWDNALKDVTEQYNLDSYFTKTPQQWDEHHARRGEEVKNAAGMYGSSVQKGITTGKTAAQKQVEQIMNVFAGMNGVEAEKRKFEKQAEAIRKNRELAEDLGVQ